MVFCFESRVREYVRCRDDNDHRLSDELGVDRLLQCEWGWHPGRDYRVPHIPSYKSEPCQ